MSHDEVLAVIDSLCGMIDALIILASQKHRGRFLNEAEFGYWLGLWLMPEDDTANEGQTECQGDEGAAVDGHDGFSMSSKPLQFQPCWLLAAMACEVSMVRNSSHPVSSSKIMR